MLAWDVSQRSQSSKSDPLPQANPAPVMTHSATSPSTPTPPLALLQIAVEQVFNAVVITNAQLDGPGPVITYCNPAFCRLTGYAADELIGQSPKLLQGPKTDQKLLQRLR